MACLCFEVHAITAFQCGWRLERVIFLTRECMKKFRDWHQRLHVSYLSLQQQATENLTNNTMDTTTTTTNNNINGSSSRSSNSNRHPCIFTGETMDEEKWKQKSKVVNDESEYTLFWMYKSFVALYLGYYEEAKEYTVSLMKVNLTGSAGTLYLSYFLDAMADVVYARTYKVKAKRYKSSLNKLRTLAKYSPENVMNKICLIEAERAVLKRDKTGARSKFQQSISHAKSNGYLHEEALAYERCAVALLEWGETSQAYEFFDRARNRYEHWGSPVKVRRLVSYIREQQQQSNVSISL